ncbi:MAG: hypothetical protein IKU07_08885 [Oscillospiraceae bacterium]|nr:hypothetical protein [Oscillospiraceae bacterium]
MVIEILFDESCNLFGDGQNSAYLKATLPEAQFIYTKITDVPYFVEQDPDIIYIGSMSESVQRRVINKLMPYKERLFALVEKGTPILATGNAGEIFCKHIQYVTEELEIDGLGIFDINVKTDLFDRYNGKVLADFENFKLVGFRSQFSMLYGDNTDYAFTKVIRGIGINRDSKLEGLRRNNLICTHILGPILPLNPLFCEYFIALTGTKAEAAHKEAALSAYYQRIKEFEDPVVPC